jgi:hypothetical protein
VTRWQALALLSATGCAGTLSDPNAFYIAADAGITSAPPCDAPRLVFVPNCTTAHCHAPPTPASNLDLSSPDAGAALVNMMASACAGQVLVVPGRPSQSYLFKLLNGPDPSCVTPQMPLGASSLSATDIACVTDWIINLAGDGGAAGAASSSGSTT